MSGRFLPIHEALALLAEQPERIATRTIDLPMDHMRIALKGGWSMVDVLAHLRSCADVWGDCIARMLAEDHPTVRAINPRAWIKRTDYRDLAFSTSFAAYRAQRDALLAILTQLSPEEWQRSATVTGAGAPLERTVEFYAQWLARHERSHMRQIDDIVRAVAPTAHQPS